MYSNFFSRLMSVVCLFVMFCGVATALPNPLLAERYISVNMKVNNKEQAIQLDDGSLWEIHFMEKKGRSWGEWWRGEQVEQPDARFLCNPKLWKEADSIKVYRPARPMLIGYPFVLENTRTNELACAQLQGPDTLMFPKEKAVREWCEKVPGEKCIIGRNIEFYDGNILLFKDKKLFQMHAFERNSRSLGDWWNGVKAEQPDAAFLFKHRKWKAGDAVIKYEIDVSQVSSSACYNYASANSKASSKVVVLIHAYRNEIVYVKPVTFLELIAKYEKERKRIYRRGFSAGHSIGYSSGYNSGYSSGCSSARRGYSPHAGGNCVMRER
jgi:hypothetical protein